MQYLELYNKWCESGRSGFLCLSELADAEDFEKLIVPTYKEKMLGVKEGYGINAWACLNNERADDFNPLRQNIVLLLAAINNEL